MRRQYPRLQETQLTRSKAAQLGAWVGDSEKWFAGWMWGLNGTVRSFAWAQTARGISTSTCLRSRRPAAQLAHQELGVGDSERWFACWTLRPNGNPWPSKLEGEGVE